MWGESLDKLGVLRLLALFLGLVWRCLREAFCEVRITVETFKTVFGCTYPHSVCTSWEYCASFSSFLLPLNLCLLSPNISIM